jgi:hypothetical protein
LDSHRLALGLVEYGGKVLFGARCGDNLHEFNLSENAHFVYNGQIRQYIALKITDCKKDQDTL